MFGFKVYKKPKELKISKLILTSIFEEINTSVSIIQKGTLNIIFETDENIQVLNNNYRGIYNTTDVLSFHYFEDFDSLKKTDIAGEIILSFTKISSQSEEFGNTKAEETYKLLIHSILHILGFDHEKDGEYEEMKQNEDEIIEKINKIYNISIK